MIVNNTSGPFSDLWALGVILYQMITGQIPWTKGGVIARQNQIINKKFTFPSFVTDPEKDLINKLLELDPLKRLGIGAEGIRELKDHPFFSGLNFQQIEL